MTRGIVVVYFGLATEQAGKARMNSLSARSSQLNKEDIFIPPRVFSDYLQSFSESLLGLFLATELPQ